MTIADIEAPRERLIEAYNPYALDLSGSEIKRLTDKLILTHEPYIDSSTNPDIGSRSVYIVHGEEEASDIARALEGYVIDRDWGIEPNATKLDARGYEVNSSFFILLDLNNEGSHSIVGCLRIADCDKGSSETEEFYKNYFNTNTVPAEIDLGGDRKNAWDIVGIMTDPTHRNGLESAWLYYAMHKNSLEKGVQKWISNITTKEIRNLRKYIGIPFQEIASKQKAFHTNPRTGEITEFGFYFTQVDGVAAAVEDRINVLDDLKGAQRMVAKIAMIGLWGAIERPDKVVSQSLLPGVEFLAS